MVDEKEINEVLNKRMRQMELEKKLTETCSGIECLKTEISKIQQKLDSKPEMFTCTGCGMKTLSIGDSYCRNCGQEVEAWSEIDHWKPYKARQIRK